MVMVKSYDEEIRAIVGVFGHKTQNGEDDDNKAFLLDQIRVVKQ
jgi:hypothetical protein